MNAMAVRTLVAALCVAPAAWASDAKVDIRNGIPASAYMAVYGQKNAARDYLREYQKEVWKTVQNEKLPERIFGLLLEAMPSNSKDQVDSVTAELQTIFDPVDWSAIAETKEAAYGQTMDVPQTHHLLVVRLPSSDVAAKLETALIQLGEMIERRTDKAIEGVRQEEGTVALYSLAARKAKDVPFQPAFARLDDVIVISSSAKVARESVRSLVGGGPSKFDDLRLKGALEKLPKAEDALVFYDARQQFGQLKGIGDFIREKAPKDLKAVRVADVIERVMNEVDLLDYQVAVESTDGRKLLKSEVLQLSPNVEQKKLYKVFASGKPFENWERWVPADTQSFSLHTGLNLHALYEAVLQFVTTEFPEVQPKIDEFEAKQQLAGVHLDRDILQAFSGECVSLKLSSGEGSAASQDSVLALRCEKPERIRELIQQGVGKLGASPYGQSQNVKLEASKEVEGFDELSANMLMAFGLRPVIGFHDGWMIVATKPAAAQKVLKTLAGESPSITTTERFQKFGVEVKGPVASISYSDIGAGTRQAAMMIRQAGMMAPAFVMSAGIKDQKTLKLLQDGCGLLPSVANVVEKFNFLEGKLTVVQAGDTNGSCLKQTVTLVREPKVEKN
ncbi:MAG: hypothetical protein U0805_14590 [Pirellulales bacterium]